MGKIIQRLGLGKVAFHCWHQPVSRIRTSLQNGGPWQERRTARGRQEMELAAFDLPLPTPAEGPALTVHLLTGRNFWFQTSFCLWTLARQTGRPLAPVIYDDGSLSAEFQTPLARLFPAARFVSHRETVDRLDAFLPVSRFPTLRDRWRHYPNIRKLIDPHLGASGWKGVLDSDLLFFRRPELLVKWLDDPCRPLHAVDFATSYGYSHPLLNELAGAPVADLVNVGLIGLHSNELDWERLEHRCATLLACEGPNYYLEQALVAVLLAGRDCTIVPAADYVTLPEPPEATACRAVMHHYVAHSKRWYFQTNWRQVVSAPS